MIALENGSGCDCNFNKIYKDKLINCKNKVINYDNEQKKNNTTDKKIIQSLKNKNSKENIFLNKIKLKILDDIDMININKDGDCEISIFLPSTLNIVTISKIKFPSKMLVKNVNFESLEDITYKFKCNNTYNFKHKKVNYTFCKDILVNITISKNKISQFIGNHIFLHYTSKYVEPKIKNDVY